LAHKGLKNEVDLEKVVSESSLDFAKRLGKLLGVPEVIKNIEDFASGEQKINIRTDTNRKLSSL
jgi:hypothetical protein